MKYRILWLALTSSLLVFSHFSHAMSKLPPLFNGSAVDSYKGSVDALAQGCYSLYSPVTGKYVSQYEKGGPVNDGLSYQLASKDVKQAAQFYFKPTQFGHFMLKDDSQRFLGTHLPLEVSAGKTVGEFVEWEIIKKKRDGFVFKATKIKQYLNHSLKDGTLYLSGVIDLFDKNYEQSFQLIEQKKCRDFPEVTVNVSGNRDNLKGDINSLVRGYIDPHTHITSYEFMGGKMMAGQPFSPWGVEHALRDSKDLHGERGSLDIIGNLYTFSDLKNRYDTRGWPDFPWWPNYKQMSHMGYYYKWIERAYLSGLRIMVTNLVENEILCNLQRTINPASWVNPNSCNTMDSVFLQIRRLHEMQNYIDAQAGGKGKGFFRIVYSAKEARQVIANGQLAVVLGVEASETFNCGLKDANCTYQSVELQLNELYRMGVRSLFPTHKFDNRFGGSAVEGGFINVGQWLSSGKFFKTKECDAKTKGVKIETGFPLIGKLPVLKQILDSIKLNPVYDEKIEHCNQKGISQLGVYLVNRMIDKGMMIELDHMSNDTATQVLDIAERRNYSGLITSHSWMRRAKNGNLSHYNVKRLLHAGGFASPYNIQTKGMIKAIDQYLQVIEDTPYVQGVGVATDMSGLGGQAPPRSDAKTNPLIYPYTNEFGLTFERQISGNRVFDINKDGVAHYGLVPDHVQDIREHASSRIYNAVMNSAEAYLQMWERSEASPFTPHFNPLH